MVKLAARLQWNTRTNPSQTRILPDVAVGDKVKRVEIELLIVVTQS